MGPHLSRNKKKSVDSTDQYPVPEYCDTDVFETGAIDDNQDRLGDTASFAEAGGLSETRLHREFGRGIHPYAQGVIRYYRARSRLMAEDSQERPLRSEHALRVWSYLAPVELKDLPKRVRRAHLALIYLVHELDLQNDPEASTEGFIEKVLAIAREIDNVIDEMAFE